MDEGEGAKKWKKLGRRELLASPVFTVVERENEGPGGRLGRFVVLEAPDWATVVPFIRRGTETFFIMVRQYRHGSDEVSVEFPGGVVEKGEDPAAAAARELAEETGYSASSIRLAGSVYPNPAFMDNHFHVFVAEGLTRSGETDLDEHEVIDTFLVPAAEVRAAMGSGQYSHALMATALFLADRLLRGEDGGRGSG
ncbi:MAG: NUDIX hydrolase [Rectinemataceae bacterium]|jgi:8-oxo-dGTP pyrophosphatase MutT (NUDIX family)